MVDELLEQISSALGASAVPMLKFAAANYLHAEEVSVELMTRANCRSLPLPPRFK